MDILDAIKDLRDELDAGTPAVDAIRYTIREWEVTETALRVRFERAYGTTPENYTPANTPDISTILKNALETESKKFTLSPRGAEMLGTRFFAEGEWWQLVAITETKIHAIREASGKPWYFAGRQTKIMAQLAKKMAA